MQQGLERKFRISAMGAQRRERSFCLAGIRGDFTWEVDFH